jgi:inner membrane protein
MDSVTQLALGSAVGYAVIGNKVGRKAIAWGAFLGTLPDLDVLVPFDNAVESFTYHRSFSHSLLVHLIISPFIAWLIMKVHPSTAQYRMRWFWMVFLCLSTHAILDTFTVYGTQLLWPLNEYPFGVSNIFIIDPLVTVPLLIGLGVALWLHRSPSRAFKANAIGTGISCLYLAWSLLAKVIIDDKIENALQARNIDTPHVVSTPAPLNTLLWRFVAMNDDHYHIGYVSLFDTIEDVETTRYETRSDLLASIRDDWGVARLLWFTKGFNSVQLRDNKVVLSDLRMGVECGYVFNFVVGERNGDVISASSYEKFSQRSDLSKIHFILQRIWDPSIRLAPGKSVINAC